jgi:hypothetical protein
MKDSKEFVEKSESEITPSERWKRRDFLKAGAISAIGLAACGESPARLSETTRRIYLSNPPTEVPNPNDLSDVVLRRLTKGSFELIVDIATTVQQSLVIPKNIDVTVTRDGLIKLNKNTLRIEGTFRAGWTKAFEFTEGKLWTPLTLWKNDKFELSRQQVVFGQGSVERVIASWFGPRANGASSNPDDDHPALQRAIHASREVRRLFIPAGNYWLKNTLSLAPPFVREGMNGLILEGAVERAHVEGNTEETTRLLLDPKVTDRPALHIGQVSDVIVRNLILRGGHQRSSKTIYLGQTDPAKLKASNFPPQMTAYIDDTYNYGRYSPYTAIAIDGYNGEKPKGVEPANRPYAENESWGLKYQKREDFLPKNVLIENVRIEKFVVGISVVPLGQQSNQSQNAGRSSGVVIKRCFVSDCVLGIGMGTSKGYRSHLRESVLELGYAAVDTATLGEREGADLNCSNNRYKAFRFVYNMPTVVSGACLLSAENARDIVRVGSFGDLGVTGNISRATLNSCQFMFTTGVGSSHLLSTKAALTFLGCRFFFDGPGTEMFCSPAELSSSRMTFQSCSFEMEGDTFPQIHTAHFTEKIQIQFRECAVRYANKGVSRVEHVLDDNQTVLIFEKQSKYNDPDSGKEVQIYDIDASQPIRVPIHINAQRVLMRPRSLSPGTHYRDRHVALKFHGSLIPTVILQKNIVVTQSWDGGDIASNREDLTMVPLHRGSLQASDRVYWSTLFPEEDEPKFPGTSVFLPILRILDPDKDITEIEVNGRKADQVLLNLPNYMRRKTLAEQELTLKTTSTFMNRAFVLPSTDFRDLTVPNNPLRRPASTYDPAKTDYKRYYASNLAILLNTNDDCDGKGSFQAGSAEIKEVRGVHLLEIGDFVNNDFVAEGTRIKSITVTSTSKASERNFVSTGTVTLTQPAIKSSSERSPILLIEAV